MQVEPQTPLPLVYQITDHTDPDRDSYYVRAVVRDSLSGSTIQTKSLSSAGTGRYTAQFNAPVDATGLGRQIDVTTTVYTDAGFSTKHPTYAEVIERWYVKSAPTHFGGGGTVDYDYIETLVRKALKGHEPPEAPPQEPVDLAPLQTAISAVLSAVQGIEIPRPQPQEPVDLTPVLAAIEALKTDLIVEINTIPPTDLEPVLTGLQNLAEAIGQVGDAAKAQKEELKVAIETSVRGVYAEDQARRKQIADMANALKSMFEDGETKPQPAAPAADKPYSHLFKNS